MFLALDIVETDKAMLAQWRNEQLTLPFKAINQDNFHITLAFLGLINNTQQTHLTHSINQQIDSIQQYLSPLFQHQSTLPITLSEMDYFKKPKVLHLMPADCPDWLLQLHKTLVEISHQCNISIESRPYIPHLSLYRKAKFSSNSDLLMLNQSLDAQQLNIKSFSLYHSFSTNNGVYYQPIETWLLKR